MGSVLLRTLWGSVWDVPQTCPSEGNWVFIYGSNPVEGCLWGIDPRHFQSALSMAGPGPRALETQLEWGAVSALGTTCHMCRWTQSWPRGLGGVSRAVVIAVISHLGDYISPFPSLPCYFACSSLPSPHTPPSTRAVTRASQQVTENCSSWLWGEELKSLSLPQGSDLVWLMPQAHWHNSHTGDFWVYRYPRIWIIVYPVNQTAPALIPSSPSPLGHLARALVQFQTS